MRLKTAVMRGWMVLTLAGFCLATAKAQTNHASIVFKIGVFDRSSAGFVLRAPKQPINFVVGQSNPAKDWYSKQPTELIPEATARNTNYASAPHAITFSLDHAPAAAYQLCVAFMIEGPGVPALQVGINGKYGTFYLHPRLDYSDGDQNDDSYADVMFDFAGNYLHLGSNQITLQAIEKADKAYTAA